MVSLRRPFGKRRIRDMDGAVHEMDHLGGRVNGQRMRGEARPRGNVSRHLARQIELLRRCLRQQRDDQVLQRDHPHLELHQFDIGQRRDGSGYPDFLRAVRPGAAFVVPPLQCTLQKL